jgi:hypothetical protein
MAMRYFSGAARTGRGVTVQYRVRLERWGDAVSICRNCEERRQGEES